MYTKEMTHEDFLELKGEDWSSDLSHLEGFEDTSSDFQAPVNIFCFRFRNAVGRGRHDSYIFSL